MRTPVLLCLPGLVLLALALTGRGASGNSTVQGTPSVWGDVTCDGRVTMADVSDLMRRASGLEANGCVDGVSAPAALTDVVLRLDPPTSTVPAGSVATLSIYADIPGTGVGNASFDLEYDSNMLTPTGCVANNGDCNLAFSASSVRFAFVTGSAEGWTGTRKLGQIQFNVGGSPGHKANISLKNVTVGSGLGRPLTATASGATITTGAAPVGSPTPAPYWPFADVNCDSVVSAADAFAVLEYVGFGHTGGTDPNCRAIGN
jgi:hypothetical protein